MARVIQMTGMGVMGGAHHHRMDGLDVALLHVEGCPLTVGFRLRKPQADSRQNGAGRNGRRGGSRHQETPALQPMQALQPSALTLADGDLRPHPVLESTEVDPVWALSQRLQRLLKQMLGFVVRLHAKERCFHRLNAARHAAPRRIFPCIRFRGAIAREFRRFPPPTGIPAPASAASSLPPASEDSGFTSLVDASRGIAMRKRQRKFHIIKRLNQKMPVIDGSLIG